MPTGLTSFICEGVAIVGTNMIKAIYRFLGWKTRAEFEDELLAIVARSGTVMVGELAKRVDPKSWPLARTYFVCERLVEAGELRYVPSGKFGTYVRDGKEVVVERLAVAISGNGRRRRQGAEDTNAAPVPGDLALA